jgi:hypothetical protein
VENLKWAPWYSASGTQHKGLICDTQYNNTLSSAIMLGVAIYLLLC